MKLGDADKVFIGANEAQKVYVGSNLVWEKSSGEVFVPTDLADLVQWYDASDVSTYSEAAGLVQGLADKSGNDLHLTQTAAAYQPIPGVTINALPALDFAEKSMSVSPVPLGPDGTIFCLCNVMVINNTNDSIYSYDSGSRDFQIDARRGDVFTATVNTSVHTNIFEDTDKRGLHVFMYRYNNTTGIADVYLDGVLYGSVADYTGAPYADGAIFLLGANRADVQFPEMYFGEHIHYLRALPNTEANQVGQYLSRWGTTWSDLT